MKILIYHPDMHIMGGGETVALNIASIISRNNEVTILVKEIPDKELLESFFGINLKYVKFKEFGKIIRYIPLFNSFKDSIYLRLAYPMFNKYDLIIDTCSNGLFFKLIKAKTMSYIHFPNFTKPKKGIKSLLNFLLIKKEKMFIYDKIVCNSEFTRKELRRITKSNIEVIYPPIESKFISSGKKVDQIITVGRISPEKKHEIMIENFKKLNKEFKNFKLLIIGAHNEGYDEYLNYLTKISKNFNIEILLNVNHAEVLKLFSLSKIYWHARGYAEIDPKQYENFGITTVEAMAAGCVPIVINLGAQPEIVKNNINGFCWNSEKELIDITKKVIKDKSLMNKISKEAIKRSKFFSSEKFKKEILKEVNKILKNK